MRPSTFRRCGAALLLALFVPSCTDLSTGLSSDQGTDLPAWAKGSAGTNPFAKAAEIGARASLQALRDTEKARRQGEAKEAVRPIAQESINRILVEHGAPPQRFERPKERPRGKKVLDRPELSEGQRRLLSDVLAQTEALNPATTTAEQFDAKLQAIEAQARRQLRGQERQVVLVATATASAYYRLYAPHHAGAGLSPSLLPGIGSPLFDHDLEGLGSAMIGGMISGAVGGAVGGWLAGGGYGMAIAGGALAGALAGGAQYAWEWWYEAG